MQSVAYFCFLDTLSQNQRYIKYIGIMYIRIINVNGHKLSFMNVLLLFIFLYNIFYNLVLIFNIYLYAL